MRSARKSFASEKSVSYFMKGLYAFEGFDLLELPTWKRIHLVYISEPMK